LIQHALQRNEGVLASNGALVVKTGKRTGRSPNDRFFVDTQDTKKNIEWGKVNKPFSRDRFDKLLAKVQDYLKTKETFVRDAYACADSKHRFDIKVLQSLLGTIFLPIIFF